MRGVYLQEAEVSRLKNKQPINDIVFPRSLARFSFRILSLFLHGIYHHVLWTRCKYTIAIRQKLIHYLVFPIFFHFFLFSRLDQYYRTARKCKRCCKLDGKHVYSLGSLWNFTLLFSWDIALCRLYFSHIHGTIKFTQVCIIADMCSSFLIRYSHRTLNDWLAKNMSVNDRTKNKIVQSRTFPIATLSLILNRYFKLISKKIESCESNGWMLVY